MSIEDYKFNDADITDVEIGGNEEYIRFLFRNESIDELIIDKADAIALAIHFKLKIDDIKS